MDTDLRELFEAEFGSEPPLPSAEERVRAGRSALRRRRATAMSLVAGTVAVICLGVAQLSQEPAPAPSPSQQPTPSEPSQPSREELLTRSAPVDTSWTADCGRGGQTPCHAYLDGAAPVGLRADGTVVRTASDVVIIKLGEARVSGDGTRTVALELRTPLSPRPWWYVLTRDTTGKVTASIADPGVSRVGFKRWAGAVVSGRHLPGAPDLTSERVLIGEDR